MNSIIFNKNLIDISVWLAGIAFLSPAFCTFLNHQSRWLNYG